jgi:hypothetical protein
VISIETGNMLNCNNRNTNYCTTVKSFDDDSNSSSSSSSSSNNNNNNNIQHIIIPYVQNKQLLCMLYVFVPKEDVITFHV